MTETIVNASKSIRASSTDNLESLLSCDELHQHFNWIIDMPLIALLTIASRILTINNMFDLIDNNQHLLNAISSDDWRMLVDTSDAGHHHVSVNQSVSNT